MRERNSPLLLFVIIYKKNKTTQPASLYAPQTCEYPFIPTETEIDQLIAGTSKRISTYLQLLKEKGMSYGCASKLKLKNFDFEEKARITTKKGMYYRILSISINL